MGDQNTGNRILTFWKSLTREQKLSVGVLGVCGLIAVLLGIIQVRRLIIGPFTAPVEYLTEAEEMRGPDPEEVEREQMRMDTDGDGLSDWHELNVFKTSPYISDSDSDGEPDNIEIAKGTDPNCPKGQVCVSVLDVDELTTSTQRIELPEGTSGEVTMPFSPGGSSPIIPARDPEAVRAFLRARGATEAELSQYSDEDLLEAYDAAAYGMTEQGVEGADATSTGTDASVESGSPNETSEAHATDAE